MMIYYVLKMDGTAESREAEKIDLDLMQAVVAEPLDEAKGYVDRATLTGSHDDGGIDMWVHDEGMYVYGEEGTNPLAAAIRNLFWRKPTYTMPMWGPAMITAYTSEGETVGLDKIQEATVVAALTRMGALS